nr:hypothetical protein [uncultured Desulfobacter sp.]
MQRFYSLKACNRTFDFPYSFPKSFPTGNDFSVYPCNERQINTEKRFEPKTNQSKSQTGSAATVPEQNIGHNRIFWQRVGLKKNLKFLFLPPQDISFPISHMPLAFVFGTEIKKIQCKKRQLPPPPPMNELPNLHFAAIGALCEI